MTKTMEELLAECSNVFTEADYVRERTELRAKFKLHFGLNNDEEIEEAIRTFRLPCENALVEGWIELMAFKPYMDVV